MCVFSKIQRVVSGTQSSTGSLTKGPSSRVSGRNNVNFTNSKAHVTTLFNSNISKGSPLHRSDGSRSSSGPSLLQRTDALLGGLDLILEHHDAKSKVREALRVQCHSYLDSSVTEQVWLKRCKYLLSYPLARFLKNPLPPSPDSVFQPTGPLRKWMKARLNAFNPRNVHLWYSWFQAKRSTLPLSDKVVNDTYKTHLETLTSPDPGNDMMIMDIFQNETFQHVLSILKEKVAKKFKKNSYLNEMPKTSACFEGSRSSGGQSNSLREISGLRSNGDNNYNIIHPDFHSMEYRPWVYTREGTRTNFVQTRFCSYGQQEWSTLPVFASKLVPTVPLSCTIQAVLEPNKIRVISKGNSLPYYSCKSLQLLLHGILKKIPCFRLIGRPLTALDIHDIAEHVPDPDRRTGLSEVDLYLGRTEFVRRPDYEWISVDYSAATDGLSWKYSSRILKVILSSLPMEDQEHYFNVLGPHSLHYPNGKKVEAKGIQTNGQLMGSILSFIILCLANLGVFLQSLDSSGLYSGLEVLKRCLINGDDMVYAYPRAVFDMNKRIGKSVGLEMSIGKAYSHREYLNINSQSVLYPLHKDKVDRKLKWVNYLNTGLFFGRHKVQGKKDDGNYAEHHTKVKEGITPNLNCLLQGALPGKEHDLLKKSLEVHKETINKECEALSFRKSKIKRNLFVPQILGGMGVRAPEGWKFFLSKRDLHVANGIITAVPNLPFALQRPLPGEPVSNLDDWKTTPWEDRDQKEGDEDIRFPLHQIDYKALKTYCRSPDFEFYIPNRYSQVVKIERRPLQRAKPLRESTLVNYDFEAALTSALGPLDADDEDLLRPSFFSEMVQEAVDRINEVACDHIPLISDFKIPDDIRSYDFKGDFYDLCEFDIPL